MKICIEISPKDIADLAQALRDQQTEIEPDIMAFARNLSKAIRDTAPTIPTSN